MLTTEATPTKQAEPAKPDPKPAAASSTARAAREPEVSDATVPPPPIQNADAPSVEPGGAATAAKPAPTEAEAAQAEAEAADAASRAAARVSRPRAPESIREGGVSVASVWSRGREALRQLPAAVGGFVMEYLIKYPGETLLWAVTDRPRFRARMAYVWDVLKHEAMHYWVGFKLLGADARTAAGLVRRVLGGHVLTRRERKQLMRTVSDLFRLVPFSIFIIVPGGEALLPLAVRIFPNLLPSTFKTQDARAAEQRRLLQMRVELATFLQETMEYMGDSMRSKGSGAQPGADLVELVRSARAGRVLEASDIVAVSRIFKDDITLENIGRHELVAMARLLGLSAYGTDGFLRYQLRSRISAIRADDAEILREGLAALDKEELAEACRERGMRASGLTEGGLRDQLESWLDLSTSKEVPLSLLVLSRALTFAGPVPEPAPAAADPAPAADAKAAVEAAAAPGKPKAAAAPETGGTPSTSIERALQASIAQLGDSIVEEALLGAAERAGGDDLTVQQMRLRSVERENELIEMERAAKQAAAEAHKAALEAEERAAEVEVAHRAGDEATVSAAMLEASSAARRAAQLGQEARDAYAELRRRAAGEVAEAVARRRRRKAGLPEEEGDASAEGGRPAVDKALLAALGEDGGLEDLVSAASSLREGKEGVPEALLELGKEEAEALLAMAGASALQQERARLTKIKAARMRMEATQMLSRGRLDAAAAAEGAAAALATDGTAQRVSSVLDSLLGRLEGDVEAADASLGSALKLLDSDADGIVSADELQSAILDVLGNRNMEAAAAAIVARLDADGDGAITVDEVKRYAELRAQAEAEADWMSPEELRRAVDQAREDKEDEEEAEAGGFAVSDDDDDDDDDDDEDGDTAGNSQQTAGDGRAAAHPGPGGATDERR